MIRILQCVNNMHRAGLETMLMNYYRNIDRTQIQFDFLTHRPDRSDYDDEIESLGGKVYYAPRLYPQNYYKYFLYMREFFKEHPDYKIMHSHIDAMSYLPLLAGKKAGIPVRIAHSHNTAIDKDFKYPLKQYFRFKIKSAANTFLACGKDAGEFLFGESEFKVIPNAVDAIKFQFNENLRTNKRKELGITEEFVVGHIGRMAYQKNHKQLIEIFKEILSLNSKSVLLLIGIGEKEQEIKKQIKELGIESNIRFLGNRSDVCELYQAMDVFVLPSLFEGLPLVGVEAQFASLPCFFSDVISREVELSKNANFISLQASAHTWATEILKYKDQQRLVADQSITNSIYNITAGCHVLTDFYTSVLNKYQ